MCCVLPGLRWKMIFSLIHPSRIFPDFTRCLAVVTLKRNMPGLIQWGLGQWAEHCAAGSHKRTATDCQSAVKSARWETTSPSPQGKAVDRNRWRERINRGEKGGRRTEAELQELTPGLTQRCWMRCKRQSQVWGKPAMMTDLVYYETWIKQNNVKRCTSSKVNTNMLCSWVPPAACWEAVAPNIYTRCRVSCV